MNPAHAMLNDPAGTVARADPAPSIRVASIPATHVYVRHLAADSEMTSSREPEAPRVLRLRDPDPSDPARSTVSTWWPPAMLEPEWVREHAAEFDLAHLHFGFDARSPQQLAEWVHELRAAGRPLVYTVHDLRNPHHASPEEHDGQLDVLIPAADALVTLTRGAADEIERRWGRRATVIPHPHVVDFDTMRRLAGQHTSTPRAAGEFRVGVHIKSLRASMAPGPVIAALVEAAERLPGVVIQVDGHTDVLAEDGARHDPTLTRMLRDWDDRGRIDLRVHDYFTDDELWHYLASLDVSVLPYRFGTHSGWLEACRDLGTAVVAPSCGHYRDQGPVFEYRHDESLFDAESLVAAVARAQAEGPSAPVHPGERAEQRERIEQEHERIYRAVLA